MKKQVWLFIALVITTINCSAQGPAQQEKYKKYNPSYHFYPSGDPTGLFYLNGLYYNNWGIGEQQRFC